MLKEKTLKALITPASGGASKRPLSPKEAGRMNFVFCTGHSQFLVSDTNDRRFVVIRQPVNGDAAC